LGGIGYSPAQSAAITGNIEQESGFDPNNLNKKEGAYGLLQWRNDRLANLQKYALANGKDPSDWRTQLDFAHQEMGTTEAKSAAPFLQSQDVSSANAALKRYIRYGDNSEGTRLKNATNYLPATPNFQIAQATPQPAPQTAQQAPPAQQVEQPAAKPIQAPQANPNLPAFSWSPRPMPVSAPVPVQAPAMQLAPPMPPRQIDPRLLQALALHFQRVYPTRIS